MITTIFQPDAEELAEAVFILSAHMSYTPLKLLEELVNSEYFSTEDVERTIPYLNIPYGQARHIIENI